MSLFFNTFGPVNDERRSDAAFVIVFLEELERRVAGVSPAEAVAGKGTVRAQLSAIFALEPVQACTGSSAKMAESWARTVPLPATASAGLTPATRRSSSSRKTITKAASLRRSSFTGPKVLKKRLTASYGMNRRT